jgi:tetratricopeptide (TPR) repeat protein
MALYYASRVAERDEAAAELHARAVRHAGYGPEREGLLIRAAWAARMQDPARLQIAESLAVRYPKEPEGHLMVGQSLLWAGHFTAALPHLRRVVALDSLVVGGRGPRCSACEAQNNIVLALQFADSLDAAEREARAWTAREPLLADAWSILSRVLEFRDKLPEAADALRKVESLEVDYVLNWTGFWLRNGDFDRLNAYYRDLIEHGGPATRASALFGAVISLRTQGRLQEALAAARAFRFAAADGVLADGTSAREAHLEALVLLELGRYAEAAALFDSTAAIPYSRHANTRNARHIIWNLTHGAAAHAALGDTVRLRQVEDTVLLLGSGLAYARDRRLHHHVRGLRLTSAGRPDDAAEAFRAAIFSPSEGYARTPLELARALIASGRPAEAVPVLRKVLGGPPGASNLWATRTELQALLGDALHAAGDPHAAAAEYRRVLHAWSHADPQFHAQRALAANRLQAVRGD